MCNRGLFAVFFTVCMFFAPSAYADKVISGWVEPVRLNGDEFIIDAKIDTGADNSSINLVNHTHYEKNGQRWVRFYLSNHIGNTIEIDRPIIKTTKIKMKNGDKQERDVIELDLCLGNIKKTVNVSLVDRSHFKYQLLVGRSFLRSEFLVDPDKQNLLTPSCDS